MWGFRFLLLGLLSGIPNGQFPSEWQEESSGIASVSQIFGASEEASRSGGLSTKTRFRFGPRSMGVPICWLWAKFPRGVLKAWVGLSATEFVAWGPVNVGDNGIGSGRHSVFSSSEYILESQVGHFASVCQTESSGLAQVAPIPGALEPGPWK